jgi:hypothetical protein
MAQQPALEAKIGTVRTFRAGHIEARIKSTKVTDAESAKRIADVNLGLTKGLYAPKKNPYEGEVTSLVQCQKKFAAEEFEARCPSGSAPAVAGGVGERQNFGMCTLEDIRAVGTLFYCFDPKENLLTEVRVFIPFKGGSWDKARAEAKAWSAKVFP